MSKKIKSKESEKKEAKPVDKEEALKKEAQGSEEGSKEGDEADPVDGEKPHGDEEQDIDLIKKMIKQYLGDDHVDDVEALKCGKMAHEAYKEMGHKEDEAYEMAGKHMQAAMKMGQKMAKESDEGAKEAGADEEKKDDDCEKTDAKDADKECGSKEKKLESEIVALKAEVNRFREAAKKQDLIEYLEKKCRESGKSRHFTDGVKEAVGTARNKAHVDEVWNIFVKAHESRGQVSDLGEGDFFVMTEKSSRASEKGKTDSFEDCVG